MEKYEIINYKDEENTIELRVDFDNKTAWISIKDMSVLFNRDHSLINKYVKTLLKDNVELTSSSMAKFATQLPPGRVVDVTYYDLRIVDLVSERLKSEQGEKLKDFITKYLREFDVDTSQIIIFNNGLVTLDVNVSPNEETVWLNEKQIADLFQTSRQTVNFHIRNILKEKELNPNRCCKDFLRDLNICKEKRRKYGKLRNY